MLNPTMFLSVVFVLRNHAPEVEQVVSEATADLLNLISDYELIIVDNASDDNSLNILIDLTSQEKLPNIQVYALTKEVDINTASWVGLENALGDYIAIIDPLVDDISFLPEMLDKAKSGADVVFARNLEKPNQSFAYRSASAIFNRLYQIFNKVDLDKESPQYRVLSKRVVNFILQHPQPALSYRHLPATGGFRKINLTYNAKPHCPSKQRLTDSIDRGLRLLVSTTVMPMRLVTWLSLFGAGANMLYSVYVVAIGIMKAEVAPGWISLSLQQSGMFFLISLVLLVLGEYILNMAKLANEGPLYHVGQEFTSARMTHREKLNIEDQTTLERLISNEQA